LLVMYAKDIALWHFIQLANPNIDLAFRQSRYELAINWLEKVQKGKASPTFPYPASQTGDNAPGNNYIKIGSNSKRSHHF
jgi:hypothetical protein